MAGLLSHHNKTKYSPVHNLFLADQILPDGIERLNQALNFKFDSRFYSNLRRKKKKCDQGLK